MLRWRHGRAVGERRGMKLEEDRRLTSTRPRWCTTGRAPTLALLAAITLPLARTGAQVAPRTIDGVVRDTTGRPLSGAAIALDPGLQGRGTTADAQGRFRFDRVSPGRHALRTVWIGYRPDDRTIDVPEAGLHVEVVLRSLPFQLDTLAIVARLTGITGTAIAHDGFRPLGDADVVVLGTRFRVRTPPSGHFTFPDLVEGAYVVEARHKGFRTRVISAAVPPEGAVEVALVLDSLRTKADAFAENRLRDMERRIHYAPRHDAIVIGRQELLAEHSESLAEAMRYAPSVIKKGFIILGPTVCRLYVDGKPETILQLKDFSAADVAMVEVHRSNGCARPERGPGGTIVYRRQDGPAGEVVYIWLKR